MAQLHVRVEKNLTTSAVNGNGEPRTEEPGTRNQAPGSQNQERRTQEPYTSGNLMVSEIVLNVRVIPRAKRSEVAGVRGEAWLVRLQAPPVDGAANEELVVVLAKILGVPRRDVTILSGERSREKRVRVAGLDAPTAQALLAAATRS